MSEQYRLRVVPDAIEPVPSTWARVGCWLTLAAFCVGFWIAVAVFVAWVRR